MSDALIAPRKAVFAGSIAVVLIFTFVISGDAAYRISRPITVTGGQLNQGYLYGEESGASTHKGVDLIYPLDTIMA